MAITDNSCATRVVYGTAVGGMLGASLGAVWGTYDAYRQKVPGLYKIRFVGQATVSSAMLFGLFLGAGSLLHCGRSY